MTQHQNSVYSTPQINKQAKSNKFKNTKQRGAGGGGGGGGGGRGGGNQKTNSNRNTPLAVVTKSCGQLPEGQSLSVME